MEFARVHAWSITGAFFKNGKNKIPMKKADFLASQEITYLIAELNQMKDHFQQLQRMIAISTEDEKQRSILEELRGEVDTQILKKWNDEICEHPIGKVTFIKMKLEDILEQTDMRKFLKNGVTLF